MTRPTLSDIQKKGWKILPDKPVKPSSKVFNPFEDKKGVEKPKQGKYRNIKVEVEGIKFDSKKEAARYQDLKIQQFAGEISDLKLQQVHEIVINGIKVCKYKSDFEYVKNGIKIVEDCKSEITRKHPVYRLKKKLMKAVWGVDVLES